MRKTWTPEEDELLRSIWSKPGTLKDAARLFEGRSGKSLELHGVNTLGLPRLRGSLRATRHSWVKKEMNRVLSETAYLTTHEISVLICASEKRINLIFRDGKANGEYHIAAWAKRSTQGEYAACYALGAGKDAPKPIAKTHAECERARYYRVKKSAKGNPFAAAAGLVTIPEGQRGRVFQQSMKLSDFDEELEAAA